MFLIKLAHPWCTDPWCAVSAWPTCYPGCAGAAAPNGHDGSMSSPTGGIFKTDNFLMNLLSPEVPFVVFLSSLPCAGVEGGGPGWVLPCHRIGPSSLRRGRRAGEPCPLLLVSLSSHVTFQGGCSDSAERIIRL